MGRFTLVAFRGVDNRERVVWALVNTNTATDAERFGNQRLVILAPSDYFDTVAHWWAEVEALVHTALGLATVFVQYCDSHRRTAAALVIKGYGGKVLIPPPLR
jgi:hypothetical protein